MKVIASAFGLLFDVNDYDPSITPAEKRIVDSFFESMNWVKSPPVDGYWDDANNKYDVMAENVDIPYADLLSVVRYSNRWGYFGSLTTPACTRGVYHQVIDRVLPISQKHYDAYVAH